MILGTRLSVGKAVTCVYGDLKIVFAYWRRLSKKFNVYSVPPHDTAKHLGYHDQDCGARARFGSDFTQPSPESESESTKIHRYRRMAVEHAFFVYPAE